MFNLEKQYAVVEVMEKFDTSIALMEALLPSRQINWGSILEENPLTTCHSLSETQQE